MPIPILKMKSLRRAPAPSIVATEASDQRVPSKPENLNGSKTPTSGVRSLPRTSAAPSAGGSGRLAATSHQMSQLQGLNQQQGTASSIPSGFRGTKEIRAPAHPPGRGTQQHLGGLGGPSVPAAPNAKQSRSSSYNNPKAPQPRPIYRSHAGTTNYSGASTPKTSSGVVAPVVPRTPNERLKKYGASKQAPVYSKHHDVNASNLQTISTFCGDTNSNRSSIISNCSSIPAPSTSSSNRNSSSSISSNFSIGSWNSNCGDISESREPFSYPGANCNSETFPRSSSMKRSKQSDELMAKSMDSVDHRSTGGSTNGSLQKTYNRTRLKEPQNVSQTPKTKMSASESSINNRTARIIHPNNSSHTSDSSLAKPKLERQQEGRHSLRSIPKPTATIRGKSKVSSGIPSQMYSDSRHSLNQRTYERKPVDSKTSTIDQRNSPNERKLRSIPHSQNKRTEESRTSPKENVALVSPFAPTIAKVKTEVVRPLSPSPPSSATDNSERVASEHLPQPPPAFSDRQDSLEKDKSVSNHDTLDEDDGYSSVVNTDHHDDDDEANCSSDTNSRSENDELPKVEPMKPLEGISSYSYLQSFREYKSRRSYPYCNSPIDETQRNSVPVDLQSSKWQFDEQIKHNSFPPSATYPQCPNETKTESLKSFNPYCQVNPAVAENKLTKPTIKHASAPTIQCYSANENRPRNSHSNQTSKSSASGLLSYPQTRTDGANFNSNRQEPSTSSSSEESIKNVKSMSVDESHVRNSSTYGGDQACKNGNKYSWKLRNTIVGAVPVVPPNRKYTMVGDQANPSNNCPSPSLQTRISTNFRDKSSEPRPISLDSSSYASTQNYSSPCPSPLFQRSGSLRSTARLLAHTPPPPEETVAQYSPSSASSLQNCQSFIRGSPKYSTVIPCTVPEDIDDPYAKESKYHALSGVFPGGSAPPSACLNTNQTLSGSTHGELASPLLASQEKIFSLSEQLASSNKLVTAYEHSLTNMTHRLHQLTKMVEKKEAEVLELRKLLERSCFDGTSTPDPKRSSLKGRLNRGTSVESLSSLASNASISSEVSSTSLVSNHSFSSCDDNMKEKSSKKRNWFRNSFSKAFKRREKRKRSELFSQDLTSDKSHFLKDEDPLFLSLNEQNRGYCSLPSSPLPLRMQNRLSDVFVPVDGDPESTDSPALLEEISRLKKLLIEKDSALTESRLEFLSSTHQIESLKESVQKLSTEVSSLKTTTPANQGDQPRVKDQPYPLDQTQSESQSEISLARADSPTSLRSSSGSLYDQAMILSHGGVANEGRRVKIYVEPSFSCQSNSHRKFFIKTILVASKTSWVQLDSFVCHAFLDNLKYLDADQKLSLNADAILHYQVGEVTRTLNFEAPELLPFGYLVGEVDAVRVILKNPSFNSVDSLSYETLIPKPHLQRYITILKEHRRVILEGPEGVGKSYLAQKMAEFVVQRLGIEPTSGNIAKFHINGGKEEEDLAAYLSHLSDLCETKSSDLPLVIILESLERVQKLQEALSSSLRVPHDQCPFIIGTCRRSRNKRSDPIQISNNFRWIPLDPNFEPIRDLLTRICRRHSSSMGRQSSRRQHLGPLMEWLPRCLDKLNAVLSSCSSVGPIGPGVLLPFPEDLMKAEVWFYNVWTKRLLPYLQKAAEDAYFIPKDLTSWKKLETCLREELPWSFSSEKVVVNFPQVPTNEVTEKESFS